MRLLNYARGITYPGAAELQVSMLGPRRAGKTSLLTVIYDRFDSVIGHGSLCMGALDDTTDRMLDERIRELMTLARSPSEALAPGILGSASSAFYSFGIGRGGLDPKAQPDVLLRFWDFPGGWLEDQTSAGYRELLKQAAASPAILVAVDAPYLLENGGEHHETRNLPSRVAQVIKDALEASSEEKLILFVPIRCEKYLKDRTVADRLPDLVAQGYAEAIQLIRQAAATRHILAAVTPVQTTGSIEFSQWAAIDGVPRVAPRFLNNGGGYAPQDAEQPLRYLLLFAINYYRRRVGKSLFGRVEAFLGLHKEFEQASFEYTHAIKTAGPFRFLVAPTSVGEGKHR